VTNPDPYSQDPYQQQPYQQQPQYPQQPYQQPPYPVSGAPQPYPVSGAPQPYSPGPYGHVPTSGYEVDPMTGMPLSDKSKMAAGLLQLIPGFCVALGGIGRIYMGNVGLGVAQLALGAVGWFCVFCLWWLVIPPFLILAPWLWSIVDGIIILAGRPVDAHGRLLRP
jgi:TM2 domain-containing membrane protein YozV